MPTTTLAPPQPPLARRSVDAFSISWIQSDPFQSQSAYAEPRPREERTSFSSRTGPPSHVAALDAAPRAQADLQGSLALTASIAYRLQARGPLDAELSRDGVYLRQSHDRLPGTNRASRSQQLASGYCGDKAENSYLTISLIRVTFTLRTGTPQMAKTSFDRRFDRWMQDPEFAESYQQHRARINAIDTLMHALDEERERQKMSKADLARRIEAEPAAVRRLFTESRPNPQIGRLVDIAHELGLEIKLTRRRPTRARSDLAAAG